MEIRRIKKEEQEQAIFVISQSFYYNCESEYKLLEKGKFRYEEFVGAIGDDGKISAIAQSEPHFMWLNGKSVKSAGIANVATLPESRREGLVRRILKYTLDEMYDEGYVMSYLYPFSYPYYRKFGYEMCNEMFRLEADPGELARLPFDGSAKQFTPGENGTDPGEIIAIYDKFAQKYNIMLDRDAWQWERKLEHDPVQSKTRTYIVYDKSGNARAYFTYVYDRQGPTAELNIRDLAWSDKEGMKLLFAFLGRLAGNVIKIKFHIPPGTIVSQYWANPREYEIFYEPSGMARVLNAQSALETINKPRGEGSFTIKINDDFMLQNNKRYKVSWYNGKTTVDEHEGRCDIECSVMALTQILTGFVSLEEALSRDDIRVDSNESFLSEVFYKKQVYVADFF